MILTCEEMRRSEERLFARGIAAEPLMERAGRGVADVVSQFFPSPGRLCAFVGKGNNGGDALVAARYLGARGWSTAIAFAGGREDLSPLAERKRIEFEEARKDWEIRNAPRPQGADGPLVFLDGLLGIGAKGPLRGAIAERAREMNARRLAEHGVTFAIDVPTGLDGDTGAADADAVVADVTVTMARVKKGLVADAAVNHVGRLAVVPLDEIEPLGGDRGVDVLEARFLRARLPRRVFDTHKSMAGRVGVVAGSRGLTGAAILCARGALRAGAGLVTLYAAEEIYPILAAAAGAAAPEVMVRPVADYRSVAEGGMDALAIGPGLGTGRSAEVIELIRRCAAPAVLDADALNAMAAAPGGPMDVLGGGAGPRLLTPHPGEMARLFPGAPAGRRETAETFARRCPATLLLKGARTVIAASGRPTAINTTGHPGMASGGMGDVLTGMCAACLGQGIDAYDAACLGAWLLGRSAELSATHAMGSVESIAAGDVPGMLGWAFRELRRGCY